MREFSKITCAVWQSSKFRKLDDKSKLLYLYFHTSTHANSIGCYYIPVGYISADLGWDNRAIDRAIKGLSVDLIQWNKTENIVKINRFLKHSPITNKKHAAGAVKLVSSLPDCNEKLNIISELIKSPHCVGFPELKLPDRAMDRAIDRAIPTETETETETETDKNTSKKKNDEDFETWWKEYPRKISKGSARKAYQAALMKTSPAELLKKVKLYAVSRKGEDPTFTAHPATWLNGERWADEATIQLTQRQRDAREWEGRIAGFKATGKWDHNHWQGEPGQKGCVVHPEILTAHGFEVFKMRPAQ